MKRSIFCFTLLLFFAISASSCGNKSGSGSGDSTKVSSEASVAPAGSKYAMKSGVGEGFMEMMGQKMQMKLAFDDFGAKSASEMSGEMMGQKMHQLTITKDGYTYQLDLEK